MNRQLPSDWYPEPWGDEPHGFWEWGHDLIFWGLLVGITVAVMVWWF